MLRSLTSTYREAFAGLPRTVWLLSTATLVNRAGTMVLPFLALFLTLRRGYSVTEAGELLALYGIGGMGASFLGGWLADRFSSTQVMQWSLALNGLGFLLLGRLHGRWGIALVVLAVSLAGEAFRPASQAAVTAASTPETRTRSFALHRLAVNLGMSIGPAVGGILARYDYDWLFVADGVTCLLAAVLLASLRLGHALPAHPAPLLPAEPGSEVIPLAPAEALVPERSPWRDGPFLAMVVLEFALAVVVFQTLSTYMLTLHDEYRFSEDRIGLLLAINTLIIVAVEMVLVHRLRGRKTLPLVGFGSFLFCAGLALLPFGSSFLWVAFTIVIWTFGEMISFPLSATAATARAGTRNLGAYMGIHTFAWQAAFVVAPLAGTWVYQHYGSRTLWLGCGALGALIWVGFQLLQVWTEREEKKRQAATGA